MNELIFGRRIVRLFSPLLWNNQHNIYIWDDVKLAELVWARDCQSRSRRFDSGKNSKTRELKSTWNLGTQTCKQGY